MIQTTYKFLKKATSLKIIDMVALYFFVVACFNSTRLSLICSFVFFLLLLLSVSKKRIVISKNDYVFIPFLIVCIISSVICDGGLISIRICISVGLMLLSVLVIEHSTQRNMISVFENAFLFGCIFLVIWDFITAVVIHGHFTDLGASTANTNNVGIALAFSSLFIADRIFSEEGSKNLCLWIILEMLILLTRSRSSMIVSFAGFFILVVCHFKENKGKQFRLNSKSKTRLRNLIILAIIIVIGVLSGFVSKYTSRFMVIWEEYSAGEFGTDSVSFFTYLRTRGLNRIVNSPLAGQGSGSVSKRIYLKRIGIKEIMNSPIIGHGIGTTRRFLNGAYFHDNYIELLYEVGIIGLLAFLLPFIICLLHSIKKKRNLVTAIMLCILIEGFFDVYYHNKLYYGILALCMTLLYNKQNQIIISHNPTGNSSV